MTRDYSLFLKDILEAIADVESFIEGMDYDAFSTDKKTRVAVAREIELIGEAAKNIPKAVRERYKELPWQDMAKMRDKISHFYFGINYEIVWKVVKERLPEIKSAVEQMLKATKHDHK